jgi:hypothetical protein
LYLKLGSNLRDLSRGLNGDVELTGLRDPNITQ